MSFRHLLVALLGLLLAGGWAYWLIASVVLRRFLASPDLASRHFSPAISILKPFKGVDHEAYECFASFCRQDYPDFELLFGSARADDPGVAAVERLQRDFPARTIRWIATGEADGNPKTAILERLASEARGDVLVAADSDIHASPDTVLRLVSALADPAVGLVSCLYRSRGGTTLAARLLCLYLDGGFVPSAVLAYRLAGRRFALGAAMAFRRRDLERIGGYGAFRDRLLDDYEIGSRIAGLGLEVRLSPAVVTHVLGAESFRGQWQRELRWNRGIRVARPADYAGLLVTQTTPTAILLGFATGLWRWGLAAVGATLVLRAVVAHRATADLGGPSLLRNLLWLPLRDLFTAVAWCAGLAGRRITWRGARYLVQADGGVLAVSPAGLRAPPASPGPPRSGAPGRRPPGGSPAPRSPRRRR
ncbi:MAG TPA: bacteriohopanetetrol glucosamine biosynthesis glycosyltransferase HpnI [Thermoanaerobaculia bacterium]